MAEEFLPTADFSTCLDPFASQRESEQVRILVLGSRKAIEQVQFDFVKAGLADKSQWSRIMPCPNGNGCMSILTQNRMVDYGK